MADPRGFIAPVIIRGNVWLTFSRGVVRMINLHFSKLVLCLPVDLNGPFKMSIQRFPAHENVRNRHFGTTGVRRGNLRFFVFLAFYVPEASDDPTS